MASGLITVRLSRVDAAPWGFRLQGGKDFGTPLLIQKVNGGSLAEKAGLIVGDALIKVNNTEVFNLRHKDAQDAIVRAGNSFELTLQRGPGATWKPAVTPVGNVPAPGSGVPAPVTKTSLAAGRPTGPGPIGAGHNINPRPFSGPQLNGVGDQGTLKSITSKQYNNPVGIYSEETIAETLSAQAEVLAGGVLGVNFKKNEKSYNAANSEVLKMVQEIDKEPKEPEPEQVTGGSGVIVPPPVAGLRHVSAPEIKTPSTPQATLPPGQNICADCERLIVGVFVRIKDKNLHVECFKCATCGTSLKNVGYYNINNKLYCDIHAKLVARQNPPAPNLDPITVPPGARPPAGAISAAISSSMASTGPLSPQPGTLAPMPFHAPRLATSHVNAPRPSPQTPTSTLGPKPFGAPAAPPAPFSTPAAPVSVPSTPFTIPQAPALSTYSKPMPGRIPTKPLGNRKEVGINNRRSSNQATDESQTQPAPEPPAQKLSAPEQQTQQPEPQQSSEEIHPKPSLNKPTEDKKQDASPTDDAANNKDRQTKRQMSLCSNEVCTIEEKKALLKVAAEAMGSDVITEVESDRPASPVPFQAEVSPSVSISNVAESMEVATQDASNTAQKVKTFEDGNVQTVKTTEVEESYSSMSKMYSAELSTQSMVVRTSTPELEQIMEKKHAFPALQQPARPLTPSTLAIQRRIASQPARCLTPEIEQAMDKPHGIFSPLPPAAAICPLSPAQVVVFPPEFPPLPPVSRSKHETEHSEKRHVEHSIYSQESMQQSTIADSQCRSYESAKSQKEKGSDLVTKTQVEEIIKQELNKILSHDKISHITPGKITEGMTIAPDRPFTPVPLPKPISIPVPVPLPPETVPLNPSASHTSQNENVVQKEMPACPSPMVQALTTAPERPYSPLPSAPAAFIPTQTSSFKPIPGDLPTPPKGGKPISMLSALTTAPETPYSLPGISLQSEILQTAPNKIEPIQKYAPKPTNGAFKPIATPSAVKPAPVKPSAVAEVKPLPLPVPNVSIHEDVSNTQIKSFPPISNELKSAFSQQSSFGPVKKSSVTAVSEKSSSFAASSEASHQKAIVEIRESHSFKALSVPSDDEKRPATPSKSRVSPFGLQPPALIPYYQQNIGEIPLAHRPKSPIPHAIKAPMINPTVETKPKLPQRQVLSMASSYAQKIAASQNQSSRIQSQPLNPSTVTFLHDQPKKAVPVLGYQPSPLVGKAPVAGEQNLPKSGIVPSHLDRTKQVFKPLIPSHGSENIVTQNTQQTDLNKTLNKSVPYFVKDSTEKENDVPVAPWRVVKVNDAQSTNTQSSNISAPQPKPNFTSDPHPGVPQFQQPQRKPSLNTDIKSNFTSDSQTAKSQFQQPQRKPSLNTDIKSTPKFEAPDPKKSSSVPELTVPSKPTSSSIPDAGPGGKTGTVAGTSAPRRGRGILNPNVGIGARIPLCGQCHNHIRGPFITALGKIWCPEHFVCVNNQCRRPLQDIGFVEEAAGLYCEYCFEQFLAPTCNKCSSKIKGDCLNAIGKHFHPECFTCAYCGKLFGNSPFFLEDALPYCENDWNELFTTKCFSCGFPIEAGDRWVEALNNNYHSQCFNCTMCKKNLEGQSFYAKGGRPFCKNHAR